MRVGRSAMEHVVHSEFKQMADSIGVAEAVALLAQ